MAAFSGETVLLSIGGFDTCHLSRELSGVRGRRRGTGEKVRLPYPSMNSGHRSTADY